MAECSAVLHTRMDKVNEDMTRARALQSLLPSLAGFLGNDDVASASLGGAAEADEPASYDFSRPGDVVDYAAAARALAKEGPIRYTDMKFGLQFDRPVEVWIDTLAGLASSAVPRESRFLFLFEPEEVTRLWSRVKRATA